MREERVLRPAVAHPIVLPVSLGARFARVPVHHLDECNAFSSHQRAASYGALVSLVVSSQFSHVEKCLNRCGVHEACTRVHISTVPENECIPSPRDLRYTVKYIYFHHTE